MPSAPWKSASATPSLPLSQLPQHSVVSAEQPQHFVVTGCSFDELLAGTGHHWTSYKAQHGLCKAVTPLLQSIINYYIICNYHMKV